MATHLQVIGEPLLASGEQCNAGVQLGADAFTLCQTWQYLRFASAGDDGAGATAHGAFGCQYFGEHAAFANAAACATRHLFEWFQARRCALDEFGVRVFARVGGEQSGLIGEDDEYVGLDQVGHQCAEGVVVTDFNFIGNDGVVFVDDRHNAQMQQGEHGRARIQIAFAIGQVLMREQNLRRNDVVFGKLGFIHLRQTHLPHGCGGL